MKTASRIFLTFTILAFFASVSFAQVAATASTAKAPAKSAIDAPGKTTDAAKSGTCANHAAKDACAQGKNFVDKNGDGKCDNCGTTGKCKEMANCGGAAKCKEASNCGAKSQGCGTGCGKGPGKGNCCGKK